MEKKHLFKKGNEETSTSIAVPKKKRKVWIIVLIIIVVVVAVIGTAVKNMTSQIETASNAVEIEPVEKRDLSDSVSLKGTIAGTSKTNVMSLAAAEITAVNVQVGDIVNAGDPLVSLDREDIEKQIAELQKNISNADALAANETKQKQESLEQAKQDQSTTLAKASDSVTRAQESYNELVKKKEECQTKLDNKNKEMNETDSKKGDANKAMDDVYTSLVAAQNDLNQYISEHPEVAQTPDEQSQTLQQKVTDLTADYTEKQSAYNEIAAKFANLKAESEALTSELDGYTQSLKTAKQGVEDAQTSYSDAQTSTDRSIESAQDTVDMQKYQTSSTSDMKDQLEQLEKQLADCTLSAPISGVVTAVNVSVGDKNTAGATMITIEDTSSLKVIVNVDEADILKLEEGMPATVTTDATGEEEINGTVTRVVRVKNQSTNTNSTDTNTSTGYSAEITIDNTELLVGMSAKAKIIIKDRGTQLAVPYDLIQYDDNGAAYVLVAQQNEDGTATAVRKNINVGEEVDYYTEVTGGDLKEGDMLIYDYTGSVAEGQIFSPDQTYSNQQFDTDSAMSTEAE